MRAKIGPADLVEQLGDSIAGVPVPPALDGLTIFELRYDRANDQLVDGRTLSTYWIDNRGRKHIADHDSSWQELSCQWSDTIVPDGAGGWRVATASDLLAPAIKTECSRRIRAVIKDDATQRNLTAYGADLVAVVSIDGGTLDSQQSTDLATIRATRLWVSAMLATCRTLIVAADATYADDAHWPAAPAGAADLAESL